MLGCGASKRHDEDSASLYVPVDGSLVDAGSVVGSDGGHPDASLRALDAGRAGCGGCARDWTTYPAVLAVEGTDELRVVSDVHGDYAALTKLLVAGGVISGVPPAPSAVRWIGGTTTLVVVGDLIDKGPDAPDVVRLAITLQASAKAAGGEVIVTMGNHEAEFLADPENSKASGTDGLDPELASIGLNPDATAAGDDDIGRFIRNLPFAARVDDWFFVHAGNTQGATLADLTITLENGVNAMGFGAPVLAATDSLLESRLGSSPPQWWDATGDATTLLTTWTKALSVSHLVMGHQPGSVGITSGPDRAKDQMASESGGLLFLIDTGLSIDVDGTGGALLHVTHVAAADESWEEILPDGSVKSL